MELRGRERLHVAKRTPGLGSGTFLSGLAFLLDHHPSPLRPRVLEPNLQQEEEAEHNHDSYT